MGRLTKRLTVSLCLILLVMCVPAYGQNEDIQDQAVGVNAQVKPDATATAPVATVDAATGQKNLQVEVRAFRGLVRVRESEDKPWRSPVVGMKLAGQAQFSTGPKSWVHLHIEPDQLVTLDRLGTLTVLEAVYDEDKKKVTTNLGMLYGRVRYDVQAAGIEHEAAVLTPGTLAAIRGTTTFVNSSGLFNTSTASYQGLVENVTSDGDKVAFGDAGEKPGESERQPSAQQIEAQSADDAAASLGAVGANIPLVVNDNTDGAAQSAIPNTHNVSKLLAQTPQETGLDMSSTGAGFGPDNAGTDAQQIRGSDVGGGFARSVSRAMMEGLALLEFETQWLGAFDLDSFAAGPGGTLCVFGGTRPDCQFVTADGGMAGDDHLGPNGVEINQWLAPQITPGEYEYGVKHVSGLGQAQVDITVRYRPAGGDLRVIDVLNGEVDAINKLVSKTVVVPPSN